MTDFDPADISAVRREGDLSSLLRAEIAKGRAARLAPAAKSVPPAPPGRRPGAWPPGTRPSDRPPEVLPEEAARAVAEYRHWVAAGSPPGDHHCECPACQLLPGSTE